MNIVVFGATGGIGKCLSYELSKSHNLFLGSRNHSQIFDLVFDINQNLSSSQSNESVCGMEVDATNFESVEAFLDKSKIFLGSIDCIINCVGSLLLKPAHITTEEELENVFRTNVFSCFGILKHSIKFLRNTGGSIIFFSSAASKVGLKNHESISSAKAAVSALVLSAASTYAQYNIRVHAIAPGLVETPLTKNITDNKASIDYSKK